MARPAVIVLLLCLSTAASALTPAITSISPNVLSLEGGTIAVNTTGWASSECGSICNLDVVIGGEKLPRSAIYFYGLTLTVQVPPQTKSGYARFELHHPYGEPAIVENAILFDEFETVLLLVGGSYPHAIAGAFGSQWKTSTTVVNDSDRSLKIDVPFDNPFTLASPAGGQHVMLQPHATADLRLWAPIPLIVRIPRALAQQVAFQTRVYDESRATANFGTHVPAVREHDFHRSRIVIASVPTADPFRATLRVYSPDRVPRAFHVTLLTQPEQFASPDPAETKRGTTITQLQVTTLFPTTVHGSWADLRYSVPSAEMQLPFAGTASVQVVIEPVDDGVAPFYAFVSVTNNETQHVTVLTPR